MKARKLCREMDLPLKVLEEGTQLANVAMLYIELLKWSVMADLRSSDSPLVFWDYACERQALINNFTVKRLPKTNNT